MVEDLGARGRQQILEGFGALAPYEHLCWMEWVSDGGVDGWLNAMESIGVSKCPLFGTGWPFKSLFDDISIPIAFEG